MPGPNPVRRGALVLVALAATALSACGDEPRPQNVRILAGASAPPAPVDDLALLFPEVASVCLRFSRIEDLDREVEAIVSLLGPEATGLRPRRLLSGLLGTWGDLPGVDLRVPAGFAWAAWGEELVPVALVGVTDEAAFRQALPSEWTARRVGPYMAAGPDEELVAMIGRRVEPTPLAARLLAGDVSAAVDLAALLEGPEWAELRGEIDALAAEETGEAVVMMRAVARLLGALEYASGSLTLADGDLSATLLLAVAPDSEVGQGLRDWPPGPCPFPGGLGADGFAAVAGRGGAGTVPLEALLGAFVPGRHPVGPLATGTSGFALRLPEAEGAPLEVACEVDDPAAFRDAQEAYFAALPRSLSGTPAAEVNAGPAWEHGGVRVRSARFSFAPSEDGEGGSGFPVFPGHTLAPGLVECWYADLLPGRPAALMTAGGEAGDAMRSLIDRLASSAPPEPSRLWVEGTRGFPEANLVMVVDFGRLMVWGLRKRAVTERQRRTLRYPPRHAWLAWYLRTEGPGLRLGATLRLSEVRDFLQTFPQAR